MNINKVINWASCAGTKTLRLKLLHIFGRERKIKNAPIRTVSPANALATVLFNGTIYIYTRRYMYTDPGSSLGFLKTRFQQHAHNEISGSGQDSLYGFARRLLRLAALEVAADIRV